MHTLPHKRAYFGSAKARGMFWLCGALLVLSALALSLRVLGFGFLYLRDDDVNVALNPHMGGLGAQRLVWIFTDWSYVRRYMPLGWLNFSATYQFAGLDPGPYHAVGVAFYLLNTALVFALVLRVLSVFDEGGRPYGVTPWDVGASALAAGWWAFHPFRVETTAWISGNVYGQSTALLLASLLAYLRTYGTAGGRRAAWLCLAAAAYAASLLTYPLALGIPLLLICLDAFYARTHPGVSFGRLLAQKAAFLVPLAAVLAITLAARYTSDVFGAVPGLRAFPVASRIAQAAYVAAYYVWKPWWPVQLSPLYDTLDDFNPLGAPFVLSIAAVTGMSVYAWRGRRRRPAVAAVWFGYLAAAAPFFGLTEMPHMASDRYGYFLTVIMAAVLAAALVRARSPRARWVFALAALALIAVLGRLTRVQLEVWSDDRVQHAYVAPRLTHPTLRDDFISRQLILEFFRGDEAAASAAVAARLRLNPNDPGLLRASAIFADKKRLSAYYGTVTYLAILHEQLGLAFAGRGDLREANDHFEESLRGNDRFYQAAYDRSLVLLELGQANDALRNYLQAARWANPVLPRAQQRAFLERLAKVAQGAGDMPLARAARAALAR